jgi:tyrosinase
LTLADELITNRTDILSFQNRMQGDFPASYLGVHAGGHFWIGGDPGGDLYASPGDPYFFLHHAQIDRTWWIWQNQDSKTRQNAIAGTNTIFNFPPSANTTLDDLIDLGVNAPALRIGNVMSTISDQFCYTYA